MLDFIFEACILGMLIIQGYFIFDLQKQVKELKDKKD